MSWWGYAALFFLSAVAWDGLKWVAQHIQRGEKAARTRALNQYWESKKEHGL